MASSGSASSASCAAKSLASLEPAKVALVENKWLLDRRYMGDIRKDEKLKADLIVDAKTGEIKATGAKPIVFGSQMFVIGFFEKNRTQPPSPQKSTT